MIELLRSIVTVISSLLIFVTHAITSLINLFLKLPSYLAFITTSLTILPSVIIPFALATISVYAVFFVLNRQ